MEMGAVMEKDKNNVIFLSEVRSPLSLEEFKDRLFDSINEGGFLPVSDIRTFDRENRMEIVLANREVYEILVRKKDE